MLSFRRSVRLYFCTHAHTHTVIRKNCLSSLFNAVKGPNTKDDNTALKLGSRFVIEPLIFHCLSSRDMGTY